MTFNANAPRAVILLYKDGSVHLCCDNYKTYYLSADMLISFLSSPSSYLDCTIDKNYESSDKINPSGASLEKLPGVTLASLSYSRKLTIIFPELLKHVFALSSGPQKGDKINMRNFITKLDPSDAKSFLLRYFLDFSHDAEKGVVVQNIFNIDEDSFYSIMREIFNASVSFVPPKPSAKSVNQVYNEAKQQSFIENKSDDFLIPLPDYVRNNGLIYPVTLTAAKKRKFKTVEKRGRLYYIDSREKPPKSLVKGKETVARKAKSSDPKQPDPIVPTTRTRIPPEKIMEYCATNRCYSSLVSRHISSDTELFFFLENDYREVEWDGFRFLICDFDLSLKDKAGITNEEIIIAGERSPVALNPETGEPEAIELHHLGMREDVLAPIEYYYHSKFDLVFHTRTPITDLHTDVFNKTKKDFWKRYLKEYRKAGSFDKIPFLFPLGKKQKK